MKEYIRFKSTKIYLTNLHNILLSQLQNNKSIILQNYKIIKLQNYKITKFKTTKLQNYIKLNNKWEILSLVKIKYCDILKNLKDKKRKKNN